MRPDKGKPQIGEPPNDGRQWICRDQACELFGCSKRTLSLYAKTMNWTLSIPPNRTQAWYLKKDVVFYATFLKRRQQWRKCRQPKHWEMEHLLMEDEPLAERIFLTSRQVAAMLGVSQSQVSRLTTRGKLPVHPSRKLGCGSRYWYSPTAIRSYLEDEQRLKRRATYEKGVQTRKQRKEGLETAPVLRRRPCKVPEGWLLAWQVAERAGVSTTRVNAWRRKNYITCEKFEYLRKRWTPWCYSEFAVEEFITSELYQEFRKRWEDTQPKQEEECPSSHPHKVTMAESLARSEAFQENLRSRMEW